MKWPITLRVALACLVLGGLGLLAAGRFSGSDRDAVVVGYQTVVEPGKVAQAEGLYERALGKRIVWRKFDSGADVIAALAAGAIDIGDLGSSPLAVAATRQVPITTIAVIARLGRSEALAARRSLGARSPADLAGRTIATPFVSTAHYSLLAVLRHAGLDPARVRIINLSPPQIAAAWARGDIDAAYVWEPALSTLTRNGTVLATSAQAAGWGAPTFETWVARRDFAKRHPRLVDAFVRVTLDAQETYRREGATWTPASRQAREVATITGARPEDAPALLAGNDYPTAAEQASDSILGGGLAATLADTARFLKAQGKVDRVLVSYTPYLDPDPARRAGQAR